MTYIVLFFEVIYLNKICRDKEEHKAGKRSSKVLREEMESLIEETKLLKEKNEELLKEMVEIKALTTTLYNAILICCDLDAKHYIY